MGCLCKMVALRGFLSPATENILELHTYSVLKKWNTDLMEKTRFMYLLLMV